MPPQRSLGEWQWSMIVQSKQNRIGFVTTPGWGGGALGAEGSTPPTAPSAESSLLSAPASGWDCCNFMCGHWLNFFLLGFRGKIIDWPGGQINDHSLGKIMFSCVPSNNSFVSLLDPWGLFEQKQRPLRPHLMHCFQSFRDSIRCILLGAHVLSKLTQNLIVC